jgi:peptidyl-Lys metalloendopeptidase
MIGSCSVNRNPTDIGGYPLACKQGIDQSGEKINIQFSLHNDADYSLYFLTWYTPFEGFASDMFLVERDGKTIPYNGIMAKRGDPSAEDYHEIEPVKDNSVIVDLATAYDLTEPGKYHVKFISHLYDITNDSASIPRPADTQQPQELNCNEVDFEIVEIPD